MNFFKKIIISSFLCLSSFLFAEETKMYVSKNNVPLKAGANIFSKQIDSLDYTTEVIVLETKGNWMKIKVSDDDSLSGWIKASNLTKRRLSALALASTNATELALAGKGSENTLSNIKEEKYENNEDSFENLSEKITEEESENDDESKE